jgi:hypothetical protein
MSFIVMRTSVYTKSTLSAHMLEMSVNCGTDIQFQVLLHSPQPSFACHNCVCCDLCILSVIVFHFFSASAQWWETEGQTK